MEKLFRLITSSFWALTLVFSLGVTGAGATGIYDIPVVGAGEDVWVVDEADTLSRATELKLESSLRDIAEKTGNELRILTIRRLDYGATIDSFADEVFSTWYEAPSTQANQALLVLDTLTNRSALRTGETLQTLINPEINESIIKETIGFPLKDQLYNQALVDASARLSAILAGQEDPGPPVAEELNIDSTFSSAEETDDGIATIWVVVIVALATIIPMVTYFWYVGFPGS
ncbi:MAG: TPM domain-containing protein [Cyanobacterium sp. T60_A2020_053]|nr:TPM domain-containing protein [Cyanobacterium sp. T60_A2020_053]